MKYNLYTYFELVFQFLSKIFQTIGLHQIQFSIYTTDLLQTAGDLVRCQEDPVVSEEPGGLAHHQQTVVEEDELGVQLALLLPVPEYISQHTLLLGTFPQTRKLKIIRLKCH